MGAIQEDIPRPHSLEKVVCLGNGTGQAALLGGLKDTSCALTSIVGVTDNGGHSGLLRRELDIPSPGDLRRCLVMLADPRLALTRLLDHRFREGMLEGVSLGNLIIAALLQQEGNLSAASQRVGEMLQLKGNVLPVSDESTQVCAELTDGAHRAGEWEIIERQPRTPIQRIYLERPIPACEGSLQAIAEADLIVFCPGSLFTGLIALLLTKGVREALAASRAPKVYFCNLMTQPGQTDDFSLGDHVRQLSRYLSAPPDYVVANDGPIPMELLAHYEGSGSYPVPLDGIEPGYQLVTTDLVDRGENRTDSGLLNQGHRVYGEGFKGGLHWITHHPTRSAQVLFQIMRRP